MEETNIIDIESVILNKISETEKSLNIDTIIENPLPTKHMTENSVKKETFGLNNLQYKLGQIEQKKNDTKQLRLLNKNKIEINTVCDKYAEIDKLDNHNIPWNKLDNWQKRQKLKHYIDNKYPDNSVLVFNYLNSLLKKGELKKSNKLLIYQDGILSDILIPHFIEFIKTLKSSE